MSSTNKVGGEPRFPPGSKIQTPFWKNPVKIDEYDGENGVYHVIGPQGAERRLVIVESGYKRLNVWAGGLEWVSLEGSCGFDEVNQVTSE
jgi:hypothetical protein